jgi:hypothetical protein
MFVKFRLSSFVVYDSHSNTSDSMMTTIGMLADGRKERRHPNRRTKGNLARIEGRPRQLVFRSRFEMGT